METLTECLICGGRESSPLIKAVDHTVSRETFHVVQCSACGFAYTNPRPASTELGRYYLSDDYISHSNKNKGLVAKLYKAVRAITLKKKLRLVNEQTEGKPGRILDIGCGTGEFLHTCATAGWASSGIEPSQIAREFARSEHGLDVKDEDELQGLERASFDIITMWHVLEHVSNLNERIIQVKQLLKPGGRFIVAVPNRSSLDASIYGEFWAAWDLPRHLYHFRPEDIDRLMRKHELTVKRTLPMIFDAYYVSMLSEKYRTGGSSLIRSTWNGFRSNQAARKTPGTHSSHIYIIGA